MKNINIDNKEIEIRRIKVKEVKVLVKELAGKVKDIFEFIDNVSEIEDVESAVTSLLIDNIDYMGELITRFTIDFTIEDFEDLDVLDLVELLKEILLYNGIKGDMIKSFFQNYNGVVKNQAEESFMKQIPTQAMASMSNLN